MNRQQKQDGKKKSQVTKRNGHVQNGEIDVAQKSNAKRSARQPKSSRSSQHDYEEQSIFFASPVLIMIMCPLTIIMLWIFCTQPLNLSLFSIRYLNDCISTWEDGGAHELKRSLFALGSDILRFMPLPTATAILMVLVFAVFEAVLLQWFPGKELIGPVAPSGDRPRYILNAIPCFLLTHLAFFLCSSPFGPLRWFSPGIIYDNFGAIIIALTLYVKVYCLVLYIKGRFYPSGKDNKVTKDPIYDFFWGIEMYPQMFGLPLKQYVNCRLGMMGWSLVIVSFAWKQWEVYGELSNSMLVSVALQLLYIFKFYTWEGGKRDPIFSVGYFHSIDIMHDRFGYYICWGCMCWITGFYTSPVLWFVHHPIKLSAWLAIVCFCAGLVCLWLNWDADFQRQRVRASNGKCIVWGKAPRIIMAEYTTDDGQVRKNVLLASGWWGLARHVHYVTEILLAFFWSLPALNYHLFPYMYVIYLTFLLLDRLLRDEERCQKKYGDYWTQYCRIVPYRVLPYVF